MSPLTNPQKAALSILARRAWAQEMADLDGASSESADDWRHRHVAQVTGCDGLLCCTQAHYCALIAHFEGILGNADAAMEAQLRSATEPRRQAEAVLLRECGKSGLSLNYAAAICRNQYRCSLEEANTRQIWSLVYTIRNRGQHRRKAESRKQKPEMANA